MDVDDAVEIPIGFVDDEDKNDMTEFDSNVVCPPIVNEIDPPVIICISLNEFAVYFDVVVVVELVEMSTFVIAFISINFCAFKFICVVPVKNKSWFDWKKINCESPISTEVFPSTDKVPAEEIKMSLWTPKVPKEVNFVVDAEEIVVPIVEVECCEKE